MNLRPITLREANEFIHNFHRHNGPVRGGKFAIGLDHPEHGLIGVAIVGRTTARMLHDDYTAEVTRLCVRFNGETVKGCCSKLYAASWRAWRAMGGRRLVTYTLQSEPGTSLRGAGWRTVAEVPSANWSRAKRPREWQPIMGQQKLRWEMSL